MTRMPISFARITTLSLFAAAMLPVRLVAQDAPSASAAIQAEVEAILEHPRVREAFRYLEENDAETMADLRELTQIPAPPFM
ncbi:MAG: hypothetical protein AMS19_08920, partial [Gemmatimonas sp. SG8_23]